MSELEVVSSLHVYNQYQIYLTNGYRDFVTVTNNQKVTKHLWGKIKNSVAGFMAFKSSLNKI